MIYNKARQKAARANPYRYLRKAERFASTNNGFTLLETMIAILVLIMGILVVLQLYPLGLGIEMANQMENQAIFLCQEKIEETDAKAYNDIVIGSVVEDPLPSPFERFKRETKINYVDSDLEASTSDTGLKKIEVIVSWPSPLKVEEKSVALSTLIAAR
ncbi:hypothetical protein J7J81_00830 [bacterium]|nr:hypothetical protein [bacterium]